MADRLIRENAILEIEAFHSMKNRNPFLNQEYITLTVDMMKVYDLVEWGYLE